jgi:hypothetical protein
MRIRNSLLAFLLAAVVMTLYSQPAVAILYQARGHLVLTEGPDIANFDGAKYKITTATGSDVPTRVQSLADGVGTRARYVPNSYFVDITDRPNGAPDIYRMEALNPLDPVGGDSLLETQTYTLGSDSFAILGRGSILIEGNYVGYATIRADLGPGFFGTTGIGPLPALTPADIVQLSGGSVTARASTPCCLLPISIYAVTGADLAVISDVDVDRVADLSDNCPSDYNPQQEDTDGDGTGDVCDPFVADVDGDGVADPADNCPTVFNPGQEDADLDLLGNACDPYPNDPCNTIGGFPRSTSTLAAFQDNSCENWSGVSQPGANLQSAFLIKADLSAANLNGALLLNADLSGALIADASLISSQMRYANLESAILTNSSMAYSNLLGANLVDADMTAADLSFAVLEDAIYDECTIFPSGSAYDAPPWGLDSDRSPWNAGMIPTPEPSRGASVGITVVGLLGIARYRSFHPGKRHHSLASSL